MPEEDPMVALAEDMAIAEAKEEVEEARAR